MQECNIATQDHYVWSSYQYTLQWLWSQTLRHTLWRYKQVKLRSRFVPRKKKRKSRVREMSQRWSEAICLCVIWVGWRRCYLLPTSPHWPLTNQLTRMPGRRLSDSRWLPSHCLGTDSRQLARSLWGWCVWLECVHVCSWEGLIREQTEMLRKRHTGFKKINNPVVYLLCK